MSTHIAPQFGTSEFQRALRCGFTLITVVTGEEPRARQLIDVTWCEALKLRTTYWAATTDVSMRAMLEAGSIDREVQVFLDPGAFLSDPHVIRLLREIGLGQPPRDRRLAWIGDRLAA